MSEVKYLQDWIDYEMIRGRYIFTKEDILAQNLPLSNQALQNSLSRLSSRGTIVSPWQNFYVTVPTEYRLKGVVPPSFYIDRLMQFLGRRYYVSLLSAAELNGAAHQRAMVFQVFVDGGPIRSGVKNGTRLEFMLRQNPPLDFTRQIKTQTGFMRVSGPELTALDIVQYEHKIGGLGRASEILVELSESTHWDKTKLPLLHRFSSCTIQRLGFLLDATENHAQADSLFAIFSKKCNGAFRKVALKKSVPFNEDMPVDNRWKVINNYELEIDEL